MADLSTLNPGWPGQMWGSDAKETPSTVLSSLDAYLPFLGAWLPRNKDPMPRRAVQVPPPTAPWDAGRVSALFDAWLPSGPVTSGPLPPHGSGCTLTSAPPMVPRCPVFSLHTFIQACFGGSSSNSPKVTPAASQQLLLPVTAAECWASPRPQQAGKPPAAQSCCPRVDLSSSPQRLKPVRQFLKVPFALQTGKGASSTQRHLGESAC